MAKLALAAASLTAAVAEGLVFNAYYANWAQYHAAPYTYTAADLAPIADKVDNLMYSFAYFCPDDSLEAAYWVADDCEGAPAWSLVSPEPSDEVDYATVVGYKQGNPGLNVLLSIGGWSFPSAYFSTMVSTKENRAAFISSAQEYMDAHGFDGIDLDWEMPGSEPRVDPVKMSCEEFYYVNDAGGDAANDGANYLALVEEMRAAFGDDKLISVAGQAGQAHWEVFEMKEMSQYVDMWHIMSYDYSVSDVAGANATAPNMPLYDPSQAPDAPQWSIDYTVSGWLEAGVPAEKMVVGLAYYGHTWYTPGVQSDAEWQTFAVPAEIPDGACCGPFAETYGAKFGQGCSLCGTMMYSEVQAAGFDVYFDPVTQSNIGYLAAASQDGYTDAHTWVSFNDKDSMKAITDYVVEKGLGGAFAFDTSMDSMSAAGEFTYELTQQVADAMHAAQA